MGEHPYFFQKFSIDDSGSQSSPSTLAAEPSPPEAAYGWQQARVLRFFEVLSDRGKQELWVGWLRRFGEKLLASPVPNNELAARMVQLNKLGYKELDKMESLHQHSYL